MGRRGRVDIMTMMLLERILTFVLLEREILDRFWHGEEF
jgi:hypothetical protein